MLDTTNIGNEESHSSANSAVLIAMQIQLGEIKGILNTIVTEHARRISDQEAQSRQLRYDLDAVKTEAKKDISDLSTKVYDTIASSKEAGAKTLATVSEAITTNKNNIAEIRSDIDEVKTKAMSSTGRITSVLAIVIAGAAVVWQIIAPH